MTNAVDVHQHLWPAELIEQLRRRSAAPMLRGWTLHLAGEPPYEVDPADHDPSARAALDPETRVALSMSTPLGVEALPPDDAAPLLDAWHEGVAELPGSWGAWASVTEVEPDLALLESLLQRGFVGLQVSATVLADPAAVEASARALAVCERLDRPVLVHPGPVPAGSGRPGWWPAVVDYPAQLQAAWWAWQVAGRALLPGLRICFAAGAGLAPLGHERFTARSGENFRVDPDVFVDTSSYGRQAVDALVCALGDDAVVLGSDRPYAEPVDLDHLDAAAARAIREVNPRRLLGDALPSRPPAHRTEMDT